MQKQLTLFHPLSKKLYMLKVLRDLNIEIISNCETVNRFSDAFKEEVKIVSLTSKPLSNISKSALDFESFCCIVT